MGEGAERRIRGGTVAATEVAKLQTFDRTLLKVSRFLSACKLYIRMRLRESTIKIVESRLCFFLFSFSFLFSF